MFRLWFSFKNNRRTKVLLVGIFEKTKNVIDCQKRYFGRFWRLITVFVLILKNTDQNNMCVPVSKRLYSSRIRICNTKRETKTLNCTRTIFQNVIQVCVVFKCRLDNPWNWITIYCTVLCQYWGSHTRRGIRWYSSSSTVPHCSETHSMGDGFTLEVCSHCSCFDCTLFEVAQVSFFWTGKFTSICRIFSAYRLDYIFRSIDVFI